MKDVHFVAVLATIIRELENWSWDTPFCMAMFGFFMVGCIPQFILLRMRWKPWTISLILGGLVIACDFCTMFLTGTAFELLTLLEMFFIAALVGAGLAGTVHIFWEIFKKKDEDDDSVWMLRKQDSKKEDQ